MTTLTPTETAADGAPDAGSVIAPGRPGAPMVTVVEVTPAAAPGAPVQVRTRDDLLAVRTVRRSTTHAEVALVATGATLLGGDHVVVRVRVADGCTLTITDIGGTVAYDGEGAPCRWDTEIVVGSGGGLMWHGLPFVVATGADATRSTVASLGAGARLLLRETVVLGRDGERGGRIVLRSTITDDDGPLLVEEVTAAGALPVPGVLGGHRVLDTLTRVGGAPTDDLADDGPVPSTAVAAARPVLPTTRTGDATTLVLERGGTLSRWLGPAAHLSPLHDRLTRDA